LFYYLASALLPYVSAMNVLTYHTVRAGGAAFTGFLLCIVFGPWAIRMLRSLKVGQFIKKDHVADLHALHKGKAGTPTMGGVMIIFGTLISLLLWSTLTNRLVWLAVAVFVILGIVGFLDDYIKLRRKHNDGLSARAKIIGQVTAGGLLGLYLVFNPITVSAGHVQERDVIDWNLLAQSLVHAGEHGEQDPLHRAWTLLTPETQGELQRATLSGEFPLVERDDLLRDMRPVLTNPSFFSPAAWPEDMMSVEALGLYRKGIAKLSALELVRFNRLYAEHLLPEIIAESSPNQHTKVGIPGLKDVFIPLGIAYILFVIFTITAISNAVNITDGLDGLAAGSSMVSIFTFSAIAYVVSRADWSHYLYLTYVPEASELFVFAAALLGATLGFLWFNVHPAEVFMGDTGSLALGGALGAMAILTKQELLLPIVSGIFVLEALSVTIQVASFKLTGKRVFRMAPLHHHFELLGWPETKVTLRFWIIAFLFAMLSLGTLKLR